MNLDVIDHPLLADALTAIRDRTTPSERFAALVGRATTVLLVAATDQLSVKVVDIQTPLAATTGAAVKVQPLLLPVLRAGLSMLDAARSLLPAAPVGFVGLRRDETTGAADWYLDSLPNSLEGRPVLILEPMVATGGTLSQVVAGVQRRGAGPITIISLICSEPGLAVLAEGHTTADLRVVTAAVDAALTPELFITPGLGDAGDRSFGWP